MSYLYVVETGDNINELADSVLALPLAQNTGKCVITYTVRSVEAHIGC